MKLENYGAVVSVVEKIKKHQDMLESLTGGKVYVIINSNGDTGRVMTIGLGYEHDYEAEAKEFVDAIKKDLNNKIENLKESLADL